MQMNQMALLIALAASRVAVATEPGPIVALFRSIPPGESGYFIRVAAANHHSLAIKQGGQVIAWGYNDQGQCTVPSGLGPCKDIAANGQAESSGPGFSLALRTDGSITAWGYNGAGQCSVPTSTTPSNQIAAGFKHAMALKADGSISAWGNAEWGQSSPPSGTYSQIAAGNYHNLAIRSDGTVAGWGSPSEVPPDLGPCQAVAAGLSNSMALKSDGTVVTWGPAGAAPTSLGICKAISAGDYGCVAIRLDGTVVSWTNATNLRLHPALGSCSQISAGYGEDALAIQTPPSTITGVLPISGPASGGTVITITGTKFPNPPYVLIGGTPALDVVWLSDSSIRATTPPGSPGMTSVSVNGVSQVAFYYRPECGSDLDQDGEVTAADISIVLLDFGPCYEPPTALAAPAPTPLLAEDPAQKTGTAKKE